MKRFLAFLLIITMLPIPLTFAREAEPARISAADYAAVDAMWQLLEETEQTVKAEKSLRQRADATTAVAVAQAALEHPLYKEDSLRWNGNGNFTFETTVGITCGYSVRLRNQSAGKAQTRNADAELPAVESGPLDVYVFQPYYGIDSSFTRQYQTEGKTIASATGGAYHLYTKKQATVDAIADAIEHGAVVIFDSHGDTDYYNEYYEEEIGDYVEDCTSGATTSYLLLQTGAGLTESDYALDNGTYHAVYYGRDIYDTSMYYYAVDGTCIANHMDEPSQGAFLWMAICLGMATDGLHAPLMEKGIAVTYGYSQSVTFGGDYCWEECFWKEMRKGAEVKDAIAAMKLRYGTWDCSPEIYAANGWHVDEWTCNDLRQALLQRVAFPVVVSAEDVYPGHEKVDDYQDVLSTWKLPKSVYTLTASANDESLGTVSVAEHTVTAQPENGVCIEGYTLTPADGAKVVWEGNTFTVTEMTANCHLTVNFVRPVGYSLTASANDESLGTVSLDGDTVTAQPKGSAAYIAGFTLTPTDGAKVTWEGNTFTVTEMTADCHLTVNFARREDAIVNFIVPEGCQSFSQYGFVGIEMPLDAPEGTLVADGEDYSFLGWVTNEVKDSAEKPAYLTDTYVPTEKETKLYALYTYEDRKGIFYTTVLRMKICYAEAYNDVDLNAWYHEAVDFVLEEEYMNGTGTNKFDPNGKLTRAMLATILYRMSGDTAKHSHPFTDVKEGQWYAEAVAWAYETGVVTGTSATTFNPNGYVTREQTAAMFYRYAKLIGQETAANGNLGEFRDASLISGYAELPLRWAVGEGIINGKGNGILDPIGTASRAEIAKIIYYWIG